MAEVVKRRHWYGDVVSNKMQKTVVVVVSRSVVHPVYKKVLRRMTRLKAHDENGVCKVGDRVQARAGQTSEQRKELARCSSHGKRSTRKVKTIFLMVLRLSLRVGI